MNDIFPLLWLGACFLLLFGIAELLHLKARVPSEITRKIVHIGTGLLSLLFPVYLTELWQVGLLCGSFLVLLLISKKKLFLSSINKIERVSYGSLLYPVSVFLCFANFLFLQDKTVHYLALYYFFTPVLILAVCDPVAAFAGAAYKKKKNNGQTGKTWAGSISFALVAFIITLFSAHYFSTATYPLHHFIVSSAIIAFFTAFAERISLNGWDNLSIPFITILCVQVLEQLA